MAHVLLAAGLGLGAVVALADDDRPVALFAADSQLEFTLELPLKKLLRRRMQRPQLPGVVELAGDAGMPVRFDVEVTTRGHSRLQICAFPPLRLEFRGPQPEGTPFAGQQRLKLVTLCRDSPDYERALELERTVYRLYEQLGLPAFRVRAARVRYVDSKNAADVRSAPAFLIEPLDAVAERAAMSGAALPEVSLRDIEPRALAVLTLFEFVIGNTDWSATMPEPGGTCCHNAEVLAPRDGDGGIVLVPYDFDHAGIVDAPYAKPHPSLGILSVRQRLYRGFCDSNVYLEEAVAALDAARPAFETVLRNQHLNVEAQVAASNYLAESYAILDDAQERRRQIIDRCRRL